LPNVTAIHSQIGNWKSAIDNGQLPGSIFCCIAGTGRQSTALFALAQLSARAALQTALIGAKTSSSVHRQHALDFDMRPRNDMYADQLADTARSSSEALGFDHA
jgi:hypothetical protein